MYYLNNNLKNLVRIFDQNERKNYLRLDLNENPGGLPQDFIDSILPEITPQLIAQYPETRHFSEVLAKHLDTTPEHLCLVNGSAEGIRYIIQAFTSEGGKIVGVVPSYFMFQVYSEMYNRSFVKVPYNDDLSMDIQNIISTLTPDTQLLILLNPNNPMGNVYSETEFQEIIKDVNSLKSQSLLMKPIIIFTQKHSSNMLLTQNIFLLQEPSRNYFQWLVAALDMSLGILMK